MRPPDRLGPPRPAGRDACASGSPLRRRSPATSRRWSPQGWWPSARIAQELPAIVEDADLRLVLLVAAVLVGELLPIRLGPGQGEVAPSTTFTFAILLTFGTAAAAAAQALGSLGSDVLQRKRLKYLAFNVSQYVLAVVAAGLTHDLIAGSVRTHELRRVAARRRAGSRRGVLRGQHGSGRDRRLAQHRRAHPARDRGRPDPAVGDRERADRARPARGGRARAEPRAAAAARAAAAGGAARGSPGADQRAPRDARPAHRAAESRQVLQPPCSARSRPPSRATASLSCWSTSTASRRSTTRSATTTATRCCARSRSGSGSASARTATSLASAATSSRSCCRG